MLRLKKIVLGLAVAGGLFAGVGAQQAQAGWGCGYGGYGFGYRTHYVAPTYIAPPCYVRPVYAPPVYVRPIYPCHVNYFGY